MELQTILTKRCPPYLWDIAGYAGGLIALFYYNKVGLIIYSCSFVLYELLNIFFNVFSVSFEYSNNKMPNYNNIKNYKFYIVDKKYILQNKNNSIPFDKINMVDDSKLKIELSIYVGKSCFIKNMLYYIYLSGITKKNYTKEDYNKFKDTIIHYV